LLADVPHCDLSAGLRATTTGIELPPHGETQEHCPASRAATLLRPDFFAGAWTKKTGLGPVFFV
jgi:hypothetical protein